MMSHVKRQFARCDGHAFYSDLKGEELGMVQVSVPRQKVARSSPEWLWHRNMVGVLPSWAHLLESGTAEKYDWVIHVELDHIMVATRVRQTIQAYIGVLESGSDGERSAVQGPMMLMFGNAFAFNRRMVRQMRAQWASLGRAAGPDDPAAGCPEWHRGQSEWPVHCSQDMLYPSLPRAMSPAPAVYGGSGCGQADLVNSQGRPFPLACWEMSSDFWNPFGESESAQLEAVRELAAVQDMATEEEVRRHLQGRPGKVAAQAAHFYIARRVPLIHHVCCESVHRLAMELLS